MTEAVVENEVMLEALNKIVNYRDELKLEHRDYIGNLESKHFCINTAKTALGIVKGIKHKQTCDKLNDR